MKMKIKGTRSENSDFVSSSSVVYPCITECGINPFIGKADVLRVLKGEIAQVWQVRLLCNAFNAPGTLIRPDLRCAELCKLPAMTYDRFFIGETAIR